MAFAPKRGTCWRHQRLFGGKASQDPHQRRHCGFASAKMGQSTSLPPALAWALAVEAVSPSRRLNMAAKMCVGMRLPQPAVQWSHEGAWSA